MAAVVVSEEQADLLLDVAENQTELALGSRPVKSDSSNTVKLNGKDTSLCSRTKVYVRHLSHSLLPSGHRCLLHLSRCGHLILSTALFISIAQNGQVAHHLGSDGYNQLAFTMIVTTIILVLLMGLRRFWDPAFNVHSELPAKKIFRDACMFSVSLIGMRFCRQDNHVPCHLQDGLFFLTIPFSIFYLSMMKCGGNFLFKFLFGRINSVVILEKINNKQIKLIIMLTGFMSAIFLSSVPQFAYT